MSRSDEFHAGRDPYTGLPVRYTVVTHVGHKDGQWAGAKERRHFGSWEEANEWGRARVTGPSGDDTWPNNYDEYTGPKHGRESSLTDEHHNIRGVILKNINRNGRWVVPKESDY